MKIKLILVVSMVMVVSFMAFTSLNKPERVDALLSEGLRYGYFTGEYGPSNLAAGTVLEKGFLNTKIGSIGADPNEILKQSNWAYSDLRSKSGFITFIEGMLDSSSKRDKIGAAFIIQNMRGIKSPDSSGVYANIKPTAAEVQDWKDRINNPAISLDIDTTSETINSAFMDNTSETVSVATTYTNCTAPFGLPNTDMFCAPPPPSGAGWTSTGDPYRVGNFDWQQQWDKWTTNDYKQFDDDMFFSSRSALPAIVFLKDNVDPVFRIKINCANILGELPGLPPNTDRWQYNVGINVPGDQEVGDTFNVSSLITNVGNIAAPDPSLLIYGAYGHRIEVTEGTGFVSRVTAGNSPPGNIYDARWSGFAALAAGGTLKNTGSWKAIAPGKVCFLGRVFPSEGLLGTSFNTSKESDKECVIITAPPPPVLNWNYNARTLSGTTPAGSVKPGSTITYVSDAENTGGAAGPAYTHKIVPTRNPSAISASTQTWTGSSIPAAPVNNTTDRSVSWTVNSNVIDGTVICINANVSPVAGTSVSGVTTVTNGGLNWASERCYTVDNSRFGMTATVSLSNGAVVQPGENADFKVFVTNDGDYKARGNTPNVYPSASHGPAANINCSFNTSGISGLSITTNPSCYTLPDPNADAFNDTVTVAVPKTAKIGDSVCLRVSNALEAFLNGFSDGTDGQGSFTAQKCYIVGIQPYLQVDNGDVWAGANFDTAVPASFPVPPTCGGTTNYDSRIRSVTSDISGLWRGSFVQYAAFATGRISGFGSGGTPNNSNKLTFANTDSPVYGEFTNAPKCIPNYFGLLSSYSYSSQDDKTSNSGNVNSFRNNQQSFVRPSSSSGRFNLNGQNNNVKGTRTVVIDGDLNISSNIKYTANYGNSSNLNIPSLVFVVKGDIFIDESVENIDAILISHGTIWTCASEGNPTTAVAENVCKDQLVINGALIANRINFMRTREGSGNFGGVSNPASVPAEVINFSPEFYLSSPIFRSNLTSEGAFKTVLIKDLPPIY